MVGTIGHKVLAGQKKIELQDKKTTVSHCCWYLLSGNGKSLLLVTIRAFMSR